jgi:hypothetical protein
MKYATYYTTEEASETHRLVSHGPWATIVALHDTEEQARAASEASGHPMHKTALGIRPAPYYRHLYGALTGDQQVGQRVLIGRDIEPAAAQVV